MLGVLFCTSESESESESESDDMPGHFEGGAFFFMSAFGDFFAALSGFFFSLIYGTSSSLPSLSYKPSSKRPLDLLDLMGDGFDGVLSVQDRRFPLIESYMDTKPGPPCNASNSSCVIPN